MDYKDLDSDLDNEKIMEQLRLLNIEKPPLFWDIETTFGKLYIKTKEQNKTLRIQEMEAWDTRGIITLSRNNYCDIRIEPPFPLIKRQISEFEFNNIFNRDESLDKKKR